MIHLFRSILLLTSLVGTAIADAPVPDRFARGMVLETDGSSAFFSLELPPGVYRGTVRNDLGDIRVFNGADETVPHSIKKPDLETISLHPPETVPFFPIFGGRQAPGTPDGEKVSLQINTAEDGTIINVQTGQEQAAAKRLQAVLLDLSRVDTAPAELVLEWENGAENFVTAVSVDGSRDLTHWKPLVYRAGLAEQHFSGHTLFKNRIILPPQHLFEYLRINWPFDAPELALAKVTAIFPETDAGPDRQWCRIEGTRLSEDDLVAYEFDTNGGFPVDRMNLVLPEKNSLVRAVIQSRPDPRSKWRLRKKGLFYNLSVDATLISNDVVSISPVQDRYWRIEVASGAGGLGRHSPQLEIGWIPHRLLFLARGEGPFTLAYGSARTGPVDTSVENVLHEIEAGEKTAMIGKAATGEELVLGGPAALETSRLPVSWKTWVLWSVLVGGVAVLGFLTFRLYRQMNND